MDNTYKIRDLVDRFLHEASDFSGQISDDKIYSKKAVASYIMEARASVLRSAVDTNQHVSDHYQQVLDCVELREVDQQECPCAPASGCFWMKTLKPIPKPIQLIGVTDNIGREQFTKKKWTDLKRINNSRIKSARSKRYYTVKESGNGDYYLYVYAKEEDKTFLRALTITGIFSNTLEASSYPSCGKENIAPRCAPLDQPLFLCEELRPKVLNAMHSILPQIKAQAPHDMLNNDRADRGRYERTP